MSIRTVIEVNHDFLNKLVEDPSHIVACLTALKSSFITGMLNHGAVEAGGGITYLAQRHHSETVNLEIK